MFYKGSLIAWAFAIVLASTGQLPPPTLTGSLEGVVTGSDGKGIPNCSVYAIPANAMNKVPAKTISDKSGHFKFSGLASNTYYLDAAKEEEGYIFSLFSFFVMPGQDKPKVRLSLGEAKDKIVIKLGAKAAYLDITYREPEGSHSKVDLTFVRPDMPGYYKRSFFAGESVPVPPVPFRFWATDEKNRRWTYRGVNDTDLIELHPGEHIEIEIVFAADSSGRPQRQF